MGVDITVSPTQFNEFLTCQRKWVGGYILKDRQPETEAMAFGLVGHKYLEIYQKTGQVPPKDKPWQFTPKSRIRYPGRSAFKALKHIPAPKTCRSEHGFSVKIKNVEIIGYIDLDWQDEHCFWVTDYKFTSGYSNALSEDGLMTNVQSVIYAFKTMVEKKVNVVNAKWIYILSTEKPTARPVIARITKDVVRKQMSWLIDDVAQRMIETRETVLMWKAEGRSDEECINLIQPNVKACGKYAGCYYLNKCKLTDKQLIEGDLGTMDDLDAKLKELGFGDSVKQTETTEKIVEKSTATQPETQVKNSTVLDLDEFIQKPEQHKKDNTPREEPKVQLNAPEHYVSEKKETLPAKENRIPDKRMFNDKEIKTMCTCFERFLKSL